MNNRFEEILETQRDLNKQFELFIEELDIESIVRENEESKEKLEELESELGELLTQNKILRMSNKELEIELMEQINSERLVLINLSKKKIDNYFSNYEGKSINELSKIESNAKRRLLDLSRMIDEKLFSSKEEFQQEVNQLQTKIVNEIEKQKQFVLNSELKSFEEVKEEYNELSKRDITEDMLERNKRLNSLELKLGMNVFNYFGIILLLLAIVTFGRYVYVNFFTNTIKTITLFGLGIGITAIGELLKRKNYSTVALGFFGGGIGALYIATFVSTFFIESLSMMGGLSFSVVITLLAYLLAFYNRSIVIGSLTLVGGYLPLYVFMMEYGIDSSNSTGLVAYTIIFNISILMLATLQKWQRLNLLSFVAHIPWLLILTYESNLELQIILTSVMFVIYLGNVFIYKLLYKIPLSIIDSVILVINNLLNVGLMLMILDAGTNISNYGFMALIYTAIYGIIYYIVHRTMSYEELTKSIVHIFTMFSFMLFFILQFEEIPFIYRASLAVIGTAFTYQSVKINNRLLLFTGLAYLVIASGSWIIAMFNTDIILILYLAHALVISSCIALIIYIIYYRFPNKIDPEFINIIKYMGILYITLQLITSVFQIINEYNINYNYAYIISLLFVNAIAYLMLKLKRLELFELSIMYQSFALIATLILNINIYEVIDDIRILSTVLLIIHNILLLLVYSELVPLILNKKSDLIEYVPASFIVISLLSTTSILVGQFDLSRINLIISLIYLVVAVFSVYYGIVKKSTFTRRFGLGLTVLTLGKYFIIDLYHLETLWKIFAYFSFGVLVLLISVIYQKYANLEH
ncbi:DUF2339 domain-containing protein [Mycoplasmatota bacterium WC44]